MSGDNVMRFIEGQVQEDDDRDARIAALERDLRETSLNLQRTSRELRDAKEDTAQALGALRRQLGPLYRALQAVFGELDSAGAVEADVRPSATEGSGPSASRVSPIWESWKTKMPGKPAEFITVLLEHGEMTAAQLRIACRCSSDTVYQTIYKLSKAGLIDKNGGRFSLKKL